MLLASSLLLGLAAQALAQAAASTFNLGAAATDSAPAAASTVFTIPNCANSDGYESCVAPLISKCFNTQTADEVACACGEARSGLACYSSFCGSFTGSALAQWQSNTASLCNGDVVPTTVSPITTGKSSSIVTTTKGTSATATTGSSKETTSAATGSTSTATVASTTSKAVAGRVVLANSGSLVGGLGLVAGVMGLFL